MSLGKRTFLASAAAVALLEVIRARRRAAYPLAGKVIYITGGSRGLGLELARVFARRGAKLALSARHPDELRTAQAELALGGAEVLTIARDVSEAGEAQGAVNAVLERFGQIDVVVNCAGQIQVGPVESMTLADLEDSLRANFWGAANTIDAVLPHLRARSTGRIVNISSVGGLVGVPHLAPYVAAKFALTGYSLTLRAELARHGITVVTVCPGLMRTGSPRQATFKGNASAEYAWFRLADALPLLSMNAERAAERIADATQEGDARLILTAQAKLAALLEAIWPDGVSTVASWASQLLPRTNGKSAPARGSDLPDLIPAGLAGLDDRAAARNHEGGRSGAAS